MDRRLESHTIQLPLGMVTNLARASQAGRSLLVSENADGYDTFRGLGKIPGSTRITASALPDQVESLHQFEFTDLDLVRKRHQLALADEKLYRIESDGTATQLFSSGLSDEALREVMMLDRIYLTSPAQRGLVTGGISYDGTRVQNWGVRAPGTTETTLLAIDSDSGWIVSSPDVTVGTSTNSKDGGGSLQVNKIGTAGSVASVEKSGLGLDFSVAGDETVFVWMFLPYGGLQKLASSGSVQVSYGGASLVDANHHDLNLGALLPGWNLLSFVTSSPSSTSGAGATLASVDTLRFKVNFSSAPETLSGILFETLYHTDEPAPSLDLVTDTGTLEGFEDASDFTTSTDGEIFTVLSGTDGKAVRVDKTGTSEAFVDIQRAGLELDLTPVDADDDTRTLSVFIPSGGLSNLASTAVSFKVGDSGLSNASAWDFAASLLTEDAWNDLSFDVTDPDATTGDGADLDEVDTILVRFHVTAAATTETDLRADFLRYTRQAAGNVTGTVSYRVTFLSDKGVESNAGAPSASVTPPSSGGRVSLSAIPTSTDDQVIARRIYRDLGGDSIYRRVAQLDDNTTTTYTDSLSLAGLSLVQPPIAGDDQVDATPPVRFQDAIVHENRVIGIDAEDRFTLHLSDPGRPEEFPLVNQLQLEEELIALESHAVGTLLHASDKTFRISGDGVTSVLRVDEVNPQLGTNGFRTTTRIKGSNITIREKDVFVVPNPADPWFLNGAIHDQFDAISKEHRADWHIQHDRSRFRIVIFARDTSGWKVLLFQYGTLAISEITGEGAGTDPHDIRVGGWHRIALPDSVAPRCSAMVERTDDVPELWIGADDGHVYWLQDPDATDWATAAGTEPVACTIQTHAVPLGSGVGGRGEPRYLQLDAVSRGASTWTVTAELLTDADGAVVKSSSFDVSLPDGKSSPVVPFPSFGARGEWLRLKLENSASGESALFTQMVLHYVPRVSFRGPRAA